MLCLIRFPMVVLRFARVRVDRLWSSVLLSGSCCVTYRYLWCMMCSRRAAEADACWQESDVTCMDGACLVETKSGASACGQTLRSACADADSPDTPGLEPVPCPGEGPSYALVSPSLDGPSFVGWQDGIIVLTNRVPCANHLTVCCVVADTAVRHTALCVAGNVSRHYMCTPVTARQRRDGRPAVGLTDRSGCRNET